MNILLIQPKSYKHSPLFVYEPIGLGYIASYLRVNGYDQVDIATVAFQSEKEIVARARCADIVGITATSPMMTHARFLVGKIRQENPSTAIILGGAHPTVTLASTLEDQNIDIVVRGEGEKTIETFPGKLPGSRNGHALS